MHDRIVIDPEIQHGKPVIRGTRVPVTRVLGGLAGGVGFDEICREYEVTVEDVRAAIGYAEGLVERESNSQGVRRRCGTDANEREDRELFKCFPT